MSRRSLNQLFTKTEPEALDTLPEAAAGPELFATSEPAADKPKSKRQKPQSVYLTESELKYIQDIADTYGESRHSVMQYAVKELIREWKRGKKPRLNNLGKLDK